MNALPDREQYVNQDGEILTLEKVEDYASSDGVGWLITGGFQVCKEFGFYKSARAWLFGKGFVLLDNRGR